MTSAVGLGLALLAVLVWFLLSIRVREVVDVTKAERAEFERRLQQAQESELAENARLAIAPAVLDLADRGTAFILLGRGYHLRVPRDGSGSAMVEGSRVHGLNRPAYPITDELARELVRELYHFSENGEGSRVGWRQLAHDGEVADFFCLKS